jgi:hypothetical protein
MEVWVVLLSKELEDKMWGDEAVLGYLELGRQAFEAGDRSALFTVICICARFQAVIPEWAADALLQMERDLEVGKLTDFNEAFGPVGERKNARQRNARLARARGSVLQELQAQRLADSSIGPEMFDRVAENLKERGMDVNRRDVEDIYKQYGQFIKDLPRKPDPNNRYAQIHANIPQPRRHGRAILRDAE